MDTSNEKNYFWKRQVEKLVAEASADGIIVTIGLRPKLPLAMGNYDQVVDVRERRVLAVPQICLLVPVVREEDGYWDNPGIPDFDEDVNAYRAWLEQQGLETTYKDLSEEDDTHPAHKKYFEDGDSDISEWTPAPPEGEGWYTLNITAHEDGVVWVWARRV